MTSREAIMEALRRAAPPPCEPAEPPRGIRFDDPVAKFSEVLAAVGGRCVVGDYRELEVVQTARRVLTCPDQSSQSPHELADVDVAIVQGEFGVAENGAVWVPAANLGLRRVVFVIAQHLVLRVPANAIVHNMHEAYQRVGRDRFGVFISGPSKTADIEQALVIGAQGPRSCTVVLE